MAKGAGKAPDTPEHFSMHPAMAPQSCMAFPQGSPFPQQSAGTALSDTPIAALARAKPPAPGSTAIAAARRKTRNVRMTIAAGRIAQLCLGVK
jgi:hypothetical protein